MVKKGHFAAVCKSKPQKLPVSLLQNESSSDEEYCFSIDRPLAMSLILERSFVKIYSYGCETPLPILGKYIVEIYSNCTDKRNLQHFMSLTRVFLANLRPSYFVF